MIKNPPANAGDLTEAGWIPGWGRSPGGGHGNPPQSSCLEHPTDRGARWATVHGVTGSDMAEGRSTNPRRVSVYTSGSVVSSPSGTCCPGDRTSLLPSTAVFPVPRTEAGT